MIDLSTFAPYYTFLYTDAVDVYRSIERIKPNGAKENIISETPIYSGIRARISFGNEDAALSQNQSGKPIATSAKLFVAPDTDLKAGDTVTVTRTLSQNKSVSYKGKIGLPANYPTHLEAAFEDIGWA